MPAQTEIQVWNIIGAIEDATGRILRASDLPQIMLPRGNETLPASRLEVTFVPGDASNQHTLADGRKVYDYYTGGELRIRLATERPMQQASLLPGVSDLHAQFLATVNMALDESRCPFEVYLPYHYVNTVRPLRPQRDFDSRFFEDFTELRYEIDCGVKETAWITSG